MHGHNHETCIHRALVRAKATFKQQDVKWTDLRERVFLALASSHKPVSAYDLIGILAKDGKRLAPVSIYRILDVLQNAGLVHKLESKNTYFACMVSHEGRLRSLVLLCEDCGRVAEQEAEEAVRSIRETIERQDFHVRNTVLEISGICGECHLAAGSNSC